MGKTESYPISKNNNSLSRISQNIKITEEAEQLKSIDNTIPDILINCETPISSLSHKSSSDNSLEHLQSKKYIFIYLRNE